jgi:hypothetical protein
MSEQDAERTWQDSLNAGIRRAVKEIGAELEHKLKQGAHEGASLIFRGDAFVMYGDRQPGKEEESLKDALQKEPAKQEGQEDLQQKRGGMSL